MDQDTRQIRQDIDATRDRLGDTVEALAYKTDVKARIKDAVDQHVTNAKDAVGRAVGIVRESSSNAADQGNNMLSQGSALIDRGRQELHNRGLDDTDALGANIKNRVQSTGTVILENPLGIVLGGLALGFIAGFAFPISKVEQTTIGPIRDQLADQAQSAANSAIQHGKEVLQESASAAVSAVSESFSHKGEA